MGPGDGADHRPPALTMPGREDYTPAASRPSRSRLPDPAIRGPYALVDDGPSPTGGGRAVITLSPVRPTS
jgi:hypothetical protein